MALVAPGPVVTIVTPKPGLPALPVRPAASAAMAAACSWWQGTAARRGSQATASLRYYGAAAGQHEDVADAPSARRRRIQSATRIVIGLTSSR